MFPDQPEILTKQVKSALTSGRYERQEAASLHRFIGPKDKVLELGAGIGFISTILRLEHNVEHITCIEANPELVKFIKQVHKANDIKGIDVLNCLVMPDTDQSLAGKYKPFYITDPFWGSTTERPADFVKEINVPMASLSEIVQEREISTIICDIEGGEEHLFKALAIPTVQKIYMELHQPKMRGSGMFRVFESLAKLGFFYDCRSSQNSVVLFRRLGRKDIARLNNDA